ncbi:MAG: glycosyltransferase 87 family protein [Phycisphaeraceae bacterium]
MRRRPPHLAIFITLGLLILLGCVSIATLAPQLQYSTSPADRPLLIFVALYLTIGLLYLATLPLLKHLPPTRSLLLIILAVGLLMRLPMFTAPPILEDDYHRYLWDGSVTAHAQNPYRTAPADVAASEANPAAGNTLRQINHPQYTTIYPPVAQSAFAAAYLIQPFSHQAWRSIVLLCDLATVALLLLIVIRLNLPPPVIALYWWCPLIAIELTQRLHMDVLLLPLVLAAVASAIARRATLTGLLLGLAAGVKIWPLILAPVLLYQPRIPRRAMLTGVAVAGFVTLLMIAPMLLTAGPADSAGLVAYTAHWHNNSALYLLLQYALHPLAHLTPLDAADAHYLARPLLAITYLLTLPLIIYLTPLPPSERPSEEAGSPQLLTHTETRPLLLRTIAAIALLFLLSPAQFPWYLTWLIAPAALAWPAVGRHHQLLISAMLVYVATLPVYYLTYDYPMLVFAVHLPPWIAIMMAVRWMKRTANPSVPTSAASA